MDSLTTTVGNAQVRAGQGEIEWLKGRVKDLQERVATLERDSHPPAELRPAIEAIVAELVGAAADGSRKPSPEDKTAFECSALFGEARVAAVTAYMEQRAMVLKDILGMSAQYSQHNVDYREAITEIERIDALVGGLLASPNAEVSDGPAGRSGAE